MNSKILLITILMMVCCPAGAITTSLSAQGSDGDISVSESLDIGSSLQLDETLEVGFTKTKMSLSKSLQGEGTANLKHYFKSGTFSGNDELATTDALQVNSHTEATLTPISLNIGQYDSIDGDSRLILEAYKDGSNLQQISSVEDGSLKSYQGLNIQSDLALSQSVLSSGDLSEVHEATSLRGDYARVSATVVGGSSKYDWSQRSSKSAVSLSESLISTDATSILCDGEALSIEGEYTWTSSAVTEGSIDYSNSVYAGRSGASAKQSIEAEGEEIEATTTAQSAVSTDLAFSSSYFGIENGYLKGTQTAYSRGTSSGRTVSEKIKSAEGSEITSTLYSQVDEDQFTYLEFQANDGEASSSGSAKATSSRTNIKDKFEGEGSLLLEGGISQSSDTITKTYSEATDGELSVNHALESSKTEVSDTQKVSGSGSTLYGIGISSYYDDDTLEAYSVAEASASDGTLSGRFTVTGEGSDLVATSNVKATGTTAEANTWAVDQEGVSQTTSSAENGYVKMRQTSEVSDGVTSKQYGNVKGTSGTTSYISGDSDLEHYVTQGYNYVVDGTINTNDVTEYSDLVSTSSSKMSGKGSRVEFYSAASNDAIAVEYAGSTQLEVAYGLGEYLAISKKLSAKTSTSSDEEEIELEPSSNLKKDAIILEPYHVICVYGVGATSVDESMTALAETGYAVTHYTDSAATIDRYKDLDDYEVSIVIGHMNSNAIGLSTDPGYISSSQLNSWYTDPPKNALVILTGCESFGGYPTESGLAKSIDEADLRCGFSESVYILWAYDYTEKFIELMADGMTASQANEYISNVYMDEWLEDHPDFTRDDLSSMGFYGDLDYKL